MISGRVTRHHIILLSSILMQSIYIRRLERLQIYKTKLTPAPHKKWIRNVSEAVPYHGTGKPPTKDLATRRVRHPVAES